MGNVVDSIPIVSQVKSAVQAISGDTEGAKRTQEHFANTTPGVSQIKSAVEAATGNTEAAKRTQEQFVKGLTGVNISNGQKPPIVSQDDKKETIDLLNTINKSVDDALIKCNQIQSKLVANKNKFEQLNLQLEILEMGEILIKQLNDVKDKWKNVLDAIETWKANAEEAKKDDCTSYLQFTNATLLLSKTILDLKGINTNNIELQVNNIALGISKLDTQLFNVLKDVKEAINKGEIVVDNSGKSSWNRFVSSFESNVNDFKLSLNSLKQSGNEAKATIEKM